MYQLLFLILLKFDIGAPVHAAGKSCSIFN